MGVEMTESWASSPAIRRSMQGNKPSGTKPELRLASELRALGLRPRKQHVLPIEGRRRVADFAWPGLRVALFVDGCYWHSCPEHSRWPAKTNAEYWAAKIARNTERDADTNESLEAQGWLVIRLWEHVPPAEAARMVKAALQDAPRGRRGDRVTTSAG